jgi:deferrochelatase/peroxidase EfeB
MTHRFVTITIPFANERAAAVDAVLDRMGNPPSPATRAALDTAGIVHFMSITAVRDTAPGRAHLVIEASTDLGGTDPVVSIADALGTEFQCLFAAAGIAYRQPTLAAFLASQDLRIGGLWSQTAGLGFDGSPGMSVRRIQAEAALAERITTELGGVLASAMPARDKLQKVRDWAWQTDQKWAFSAEATPFLFGGKARTPIVVATLAAITAAQLGWPLLVVPIVLMLLAGIPFGLLITLVLLVAVAALGLMELRQLEAANTPNDTAPDAARLGEVLRRENLGAQNLLAACSTMQAGWFRRFTLRVAFCMVTLGASRVYRPGYLRTIAVIHFARWVLIPGTDKLLFYSNFSDTWESYLEDFISKAADGLTAVWSNTVGFPRARFLFGGGAADGDRFRRWARRQQMPVLFWYCAYPTLKAPRIRLNAAIRRGLADARTDAEAEDWLSCFGSVPRAPFELQKPEIQTLLFGGLSRLRYSAGVILSFDGAPKAARAWLASVADRITYAEHVASDHAMTVAFSATGLTKLGLAADDLATFSVAFQQGMMVPWRARLLGDEGNQAPESWLWGAADTTDALVYLFARDEAGLAQAMATLQSGAQAHGHRVVFQQVMKPLPPHGQVYEPFGFADGVSQPVLRDTPRARVPRNAGHVVDAGEFVLGYPDLRGYLPPTPTVGASRDPAGLLPEYVADLNGTREPYSSGGSDLRDFGRNGSYMVVRHLEQDVAALHQWADTAAGQLIRDEQNVWGLPQPDLAELVTAKVVGRWKDGRSLVRHDHAPNSAIAVRHNAAPDNDFLFSREDPQGLKCPLGSHMRRANPRDDLDIDGPAQLAIVNRHRLMRVGRQYEAVEGGKPGLLFTCLNADIERQFEFVQQTWLRGPNFHDLPNEPDPMLGAGDRVFTLPTRQGPVRLTGLADFVRVRGGGYFFMPSRSAIRYLSS